MFTIQELETKKELAEYYECTQTTEKKLKKFSLEKLQPLSVLKSAQSQKLLVSVCIGTNCFVKGSDALLRRITAHVRAENWEDRVQVEASFCFENCGQAPNVRVGSKLVSRATFEEVCRVIAVELAAVGSGAAI